MKTFRLLLLFCILPWMAMLASAQRTPTEYRSLDATQPIVFTGDRIRYAGEEIVLGPKAFFVDGQLTDEEADRHQYVFNSFHQAAAHLTPGTAADPMRVYIAPYVYWIDDPDDPGIRTGKDGREPFGLVVRCDYLHLIGLNSHPENTVLAARRGQAQGAIGNFTMFDFWGDGLLVKNLTMGNFCNVDLDYPLKKELGREKRMSSITQAHVAYCHGDKVVAQNVRFISRLNMNPLNGARRILFDHCHMESTDDALTGTGVYLNCTLDFWGARPFWCSDKSGAVFLNCDFTVCHDERRQYFCKAVGPLSIIDCRYHVGRPLYAGWTHTPTDWLRCYQHQVTMDGQPYVIGAEKPYNTVCLEQKEQLKAFRLTTDEDSVIYNTYNLLRGDDDWDPLHVRPVIEALGRRDGKNYADMATCLSVTPLAATLQTGGTPLRLKATVQRHANYPLDNVPVRWKIQPGCETYARLSTDVGYECTVTPTLHTDQPKQFSVMAYTDDGLEGAAELTVIPDYLEAPAFTEAPRLTLTNGVARLHYRLDLQGRADESVITWYKSVDPEGTRKYTVAVSRLGTPETAYRLTREDIGYYLIATIQPKHLRCLPGPGQTVATASPVRADEVQASQVFETDFRNFPCANQPVTAPGLWTFDGYKPADTQAYVWPADNPADDFWVYGPGINNALGTGVYQNRRGARMRFTPLAGAYGDMEVILRVDPAKTAGQGFGSPTGQYMDICLKFDTQTLSGYGLRIVRTTKYSDAVDFVLVEYTNGQVAPISEPISTSCYLTGCTIRLSATGNRLTAHAETTTARAGGPHPDPNVRPTVDLSAPITPTGQGGFCIQHTGSAPGESITLFHYLRIAYSGL